jgi:hypothetical protein
VWLIQLLENSLQPGPGRHRGTEGSEALRGIVAMPGQVPLNGGFDNGVCLGVDRPLVFQDPAQGLVPVVGPHVQGGGQRGMADQVHLQCQRAEQQVAVGG